MFYNFFSNYFEKGIKATHENKIDFYESNAISFSFLPFFS